MQRWLKENVQGDKEYRQKQLIKPKVEILL